LSSSDDFEIGSNYSSSLADATYLTATFKVVATGEPKFNYMFESGNTCVNPAHARLWFARTGWLKGGEFFRWWANSDAYKLAPRGATLAVPLGERHRETWKSRLSFARRVP
jgi:hypothetical protein